MAGDCPAKARVKETSASCDVELLDQAEAHDVLALVRIPHARRAASTVLS